MKINFTKKAFWLILSILLVSLQAWSQKQTTLDIALRYVEQNRAEWKLTEADIEGMFVNDQYQTKHNGATHIYFIQGHAGIEVYNALMGVHVTSKGEVAYVANDFLTDIEHAVNATVPLYSAYEAIDKAAAHLGLYIDAPLRLLSQTDDHEFVYDGGSISNSDIELKLMYQPMPKSGELRLAWKLAIDMKGTSDYWSMRLDALSGELLDKNNWTVYCNFNGDEGHRHGDYCGLAERVQAKSLLSVNEAQMVQNTLLNDGAQYRVFPIPFESPLDGSRKLLIDPHDPIASPQGWHDNNNQPGAEFSISRGNNVHAYLDTDDDNASDGGEPDGGAELIFDFPFLQDLEPDTSQDAAITQLFYMTNVIHDFTYSYGFDEAAGNFQQNNFGNGGLGGDYVFAEGQDGGGLNNANFSTPGDGGNGRMQMFLWSQAGGRVLRVLEPEGIAGGYETGTANFGPQVDTIPLIGFVAEAFDGTNDPDKACETIINAAEVVGKVAMINRGICFFEEKTANAEAAGAIAVIICNFEENTIGMAGVESIPNPGIPTVSLKNSDCQLIRQLLNVGVRVVLQIPEDNGPDQLDGDFDNGIMAHEFGHGISNRLTGGPSASGCLNNDEHMGEGWSDFFLLVMTAKPGDTGEMTRGIGNYVLRAGTNGGGFRRLPYSTDMNINDQTFDDIIGTGAPHPLGEVWTSALWDMYWAFVDVYGWDDDLYHGTGGNNLAIQLVMDGMKFQNCNPGFINGRDAIIAADIINNDGVHECLLWEVFARRGLGWSADQGSEFDRNDGREAFDSRPECVKELKVSKTATDLIQAGDEILLSLTVTNHKEEAVTGVIATDELPQGTAYVAGSATGGFEVNTSGGMISFDIGELEADETVIITYRLSTSAEFKSIRQFFDDMENGDENWIFDALEGFNIWDLTDQLAFSGDFSWFVPDSELENDQILRNLEPILVSGSQPVLRFYHNYNTEAGTDGGVVQISTDGGVNWDDVGDLLFKNGFRGALAYGTFAIPNLEAFWGDSEGFVDTYLDLTPYQGQEILVRFRFGSDEEADEVEEGIGWYMDDFEVMDMFNYNGEACVMSNEGDQACAIAPFRGTIVQPGTSTATDDPFAEAINLAIYPNPARDLINIAVTTENARQITIDLLTADGRLLMQKNLQANGGYQLFPLNVAQLPRGFYFIRVSTGETVSTNKIVIK